MEDLLVHNFTIKSQAGEYSVEFDHDLLNTNKLNELGTHYIIDKNVFALLGEKVYQNIQYKELILIDANEYTKSYQGIEPIIAQLIEKKLNRFSHLVAIGGGITQDITCFIATTFMRGVTWSFVPTTLLAQADSCIGSKSSINFNNYKNILGSFNPPNKIIICNQFLKHLDDNQIKSGIGEIIKLYIVDGKLVSEKEIRTNLDFHLYTTLKIKQKFIEQDEFDQGIRNILNYGHCFGHAIESATNFEIPHGIAVSMGMDIANKLSLFKQLISAEFYNDVHSILLENYHGFNNTFINKNKIYNALIKDKKNTGNIINIILPVKNNLTKFKFNNDTYFWKDIDNVIDSMNLKILS